MIIVSNHLLATTHISFPKDIVVRVNLAWMHDMTSARAVLDSIANEGYTVYLDYPQGRTKPPKPMFSLEAALTLANESRNIRCFAVSNVEDSDSIKSIRDRLDQGIELVPKIETVEGIRNFKDIMDAIGSQHAMLDKEDLYLSVNGDSVSFNNMVEHIRMTAKNINVTLLELQGVVFAQ